MDKLALKKMFPPDKIKIVDNSCYIDATKKDCVLEELKKRGFPVRLVSFLDEFAGISLMTKIDKNMYQRFDVVLPQISQTNDHERLRIGVIICGAKKESVYYDTMHEDNFIINDNIIGRSIEGLFAYFSTDKGILPFTIYPETKELLRKYGWYEGRSTEIRDIVSKFEEEGTPISSSQKAFLQEFGGIKGFSTGHEAFEIYDNCETSHSHSFAMQFHKRKLPTANDKSSYSSINIIAYHNNIDMLCVGTIGDGLIPIWISTDGVLFTGQGTQLGRTIMEGLQTVLLS